MVSQIGGTIMTGVDANTGLARFREEAPHYKDNSNEAGLADLRDPLSFDEEGFMANMVNVQEGGSRRKRRVKSKKRRTRKSRKRKSRKRK